MTGARGSETRRSLPKVAPSPKPGPLTVRGSLPLAQRPAELFRVANGLFDQGLHWVDFYNAVLGVGGVLERLFPTPVERQYCERAEEYRQVQEMLSALRSIESSHRGEKPEPQRMITVRIPKSLHDALRVEADRHSISINKLCISKLVQAIDARHVPEEKGKRRGRRPGPQGHRRRPGRSSEE